MASLSFSLKSIPRCCSDLFHLPIVETCGGVELIPLGVEELLMLFFYLCFIAGLLLVFRRASTQLGGAVPLGACAGRGASGESDVLHPSEGLTTASPAPKTMLAVLGGLLLGIPPCFWGFVRVQVPEAGEMDDSVPCCREFCLICSFWMSSTGGLLLVVFLLDSAQSHRSCAIRQGRLLVTLSCSVLMHLLVPENGGFVESAPAGFEVPLFLFLLVLCFMGGLMLVIFGASSTLGNNISFRFGGTGAGENGATLGSQEDNRASAPSQSSIRPALMLVVLSCAGLLHFFDGGRA